MLPTSKAIFLAGPPGAGKNFISQQVLSDLGLVEIDPDVAFEAELLRQGLSLQMPDHEIPLRQTAREATLEVTQDQRDAVIRDRQGIILNFTGQNADKIANDKRNLEVLGYECAMVFVYVSDDASRQRNIARGKNGRRTVPEDVRTQVYADVMENRPKYVAWFGQNFYEVDLTAPLQPTSRLLLDLWKSLRAWVFQASDESEMVSLLDEEDATPALKAQQDAEKDKLAARQADQMAQAKVKDLEDKLEKDLDRMRQNQLRKRQGLKPLPPPPKQQKKKV